MRLGWHVGLPGPFSVSGRIGGGKKRRSRGRSRRNYGGGSDWNYQKPQWQKNWEAQASPGQLAFRNIAAAVTLIVIALWIIL
jgi:hypothetical protein